MVADGANDVAVRTVSVCVKEKVENAYVGLAVAASGGFEDELH